MKRLIALGIFGVFLFFSLTIWAQVPQLLNYQGRLTDDKGIPIITPPPVRFSLYQGGDAATPGSGTLVYQEDASVTPDDNGVFNHLIGSGTVISGALDSSVFQTADPVFLEITIDPAGANETLLPRKQIVTVGYSFKSELADDADTVDGQDASAFAPVVHNHDPDYINEGQADSVTSSMIVDGTIVDADINAGANIAASKINSTGLDADLLDGKDSEAFVHTTGDNMTGTLNIVTSYTPALSGTTSNTSGMGVYGEATATVGTTYGVYGKCGNSIGSYGVYGTSSGWQGRGVYGEASHASGVVYGVYGYSKSNSGAGVFGRAPKCGVYGQSDYFYGNGVYGTSSGTQGTGVYGYASSSSGDTYGVYGESDSPDGRGVYGIAPTYGVYGYTYGGTGGENYAVYGYTTNNLGYGVKGKGLMCGVMGHAFNTSGINYAVYGVTSSESGYGGYFVGKVHVDGNFTVSGSKTCVQPIDNGKKVLLYAMESPEIWFEDFGTGKLVNGQAVVDLEGVFTQAANTEIGYFVFPIPNGECNGLYISRKDKDSFEVRELGGGTSSISFDYRIVAKRRGYEEVRFEEFNEPEQTPEEPNLPIEKK